MTTDKMTLEQVRDALRGLLTRTTEYLTVHDALEMADAIDAHLAPREVSEQDVERARIAYKTIKRYHTADYPEPIGSIRSVADINRNDDDAWRAALQADRQRGGGVSFPAVFIGEIDGKHVGLHGSIESVEAIEALLAQRGQVREGFDWDAAWTLIRSFGYTTKGQTDELCDALESIFGKSPDSDAEGKGNG